MISKYRAFLGAAALAFACATGANSLPIHPQFHGATESDFRHELARWAAEVSALDIPAEYPDTYVETVEAPKLGRRLTEEGNAVLILLAHAKQRGFDDNSIVLDPAATTILDAIARFLEVHRGKRLVPPQLFEIAIEIDRRQQAAGIEGWGPGSATYRSHMMRRGTWLLEVGRAAEAVRMFDASKIDLESLAAKATDDDFVLFHTWSTAIAEAGDGARSVKLRRIAFDARQDIDYGRMTTQALRLRIALRDAEDYAGSARFMAELLRRSDLDPAARELFQSYRLIDLYQAGQFEPAAAEAAVSMYASESANVRREALGISLRIQNDQGKYAEALATLAKWEGQEGASISRTGMVDRTRVEVERAMLGAGNDGIDAFTAWAMALQYNDNIAVEDLEDVVALARGRIASPQLTLLESALQQRKAFALGAQSDSLMPFAEAWLQPISSFGVAALPRAQLEQRLEYVADGRPTNGSGMRQFTARYFAATIAASRGDWSPAIAFQAEVTKLAKARSAAAAPCFEILSLYPAARAAGAKGPAMPDCGVETREDRLDALARNNAVVATNFDGDARQAVALLAPGLVRIDAAKVSRRDVHMGSNASADRISADRWEVYPQWVELMRRESVGQPDPGTIDLVFRRLQGAMIDSVAEGINRAAAERIASATDPDLVDMMREYHRIADKKGELPSVQAPATTSEEREADRRREAEGRIAAAQQDMRMEDIRARIDAKFPGYFELIEPAPLGISEIQERLGPAEALLLIYPIGGRIHQVVIDKSGADWTSGEMDPFELDRLVNRLLWDVGAKVEVAAEAKQRWSDDAGGAYAFDRKSAYRLYQAAIAPAAARLHGKRRVFVSTKGALASIPLGILVSAPPQGDDSSPGDLRKTAWVAEQFAIVNLPSIPSLRLLERRAARPDGRDDVAFLGFGDPVLTGKSRRRGGGARDERMLRQASGEPDDAAVPLLERIRRLARLPGTERELTDIQASLGAPSNSIRLAAEATEYSVRSADLSRASIIAFATHGLMPGELDGLEEAGLVMTPPSAASPADDGFLSASEIATLKLRADWVLLSACNTAVAKQYGATSLTDSFFYAGARAVLASHWPVNDDAAARLTSTAISLQKATPALSRAEALQLAMRAVRNDASHDRIDELGLTAESWAHPSIWAPYSIFGDVDR